jgi:glycosyltransferase involved in cell wall biosynthesis
LVAVLIRDMDTLGLDIVIATYNRAAFLRLLLQSLLRATAPDELAVRVFVVDNNSTDDTADVIAECAPDFGRRFHHVVERRPGKSHALNTGIAMGTGDLVAFLDDDELISPEWYRAIASSFADADVGFISGRCLPRWPAPAPEWLPTEYSAVVGIIDGGPRVREFRGDYNGTLHGGNSVVRRAVLSRVKPFSPDLGPRQDRRLLSCEDEEMHLQLLEAGERGLYVPALLIEHFVHPGRISRRYHRQWCFWRGVSKSRLHERHPSGLPTIAGVPRFLFGAAVRGFVGMTPLPFVGRRAPQRFSSELALWDLAGFIYGRLFYRGVGEMSDAAARAEAVAKNQRDYVAEIV